MADATLALVPPDVSDEEALLLGDIFSTAYFAACNAGIAELAAIAAVQREAGPVVAIVGCGPVALLAVLGERRRLPSPSLSARWQPSFPGRQHRLDHSTSVRYLCRRP